MTKMKLALCLALAATAGVAQAESVPTLDGTFTVIESVAPLGSSLKFLSGGNGLIGTGGAWPTYLDTPANRAFAMESADHNWMQFDNFRDPGGRGSINMEAPGGASLSSVIAVAGYDHDFGTPYEGMEFIVWASNDGVTWTEGTISAIYRDGFDTAIAGNGPTDNYSTLWTFGRAIPPGGGRFIGGGYRYFSITGGDHLIGIATGEGEIDALYAVGAIPEPETYAMLLAGLGLLGFAARRRKLKEAAAA